MPPICIFPISFVKRFDGHFQGVLDEHYSNVSVHYLLLRKRINNNDIPYVPDVSLLLLFQVICPQKSIWKDSTCAKYKHTSLAKTPNELFLFFFFCNPKPLGFSMP